MDIELLAQRFYEYSIHMRGLSRTTVRNHRGWINCYRRFADLRNIEDVTDESLRALFLHGRTVLQWKPNTFMGLYMSLRAFFKWCVANGYMASNPVLEIEKPRLERRIPPKLNLQDALKLLDVAYNYPYDYKYLRYRNHAIFSMFILAGLRKSELLRLRLADVDIENRTIFVSQGKGNKDRMIPMSFTLAESLKRYACERKRLGKTCPQFFTSLNRDTGFTDTGLKRLVIKMRKASGLSFSVHKLRHTFATLMLEGGCDIYSLSRIMGHSDIKTTTIYLSASVEHLRSQVGKHPLGEAVRL